jgi:hypothetical protein
MADEQASTLVFLQNFYTDVTLYMPFEAHERAPVAAPATEPVAQTTAAIPPVAALPVPVAPLAPAVAAAAPVALAPPVPVVVPSLPPVAAAPAVPLAVPTAKLPSIAAIGLNTAPAAAPPLAKPAAPAPVVPPATPAAAAPAAPEVPPYLLTTFSTLGDNAQGVVILVRLPAERFRKLHRNVFLNNLLKAINLVMADVVLVNVEGPYPVALANLRKEIAATCILAFGKNLLDVAVRTTQIYEPVHFPNQGLNYLAGAEVEMIEYENGLKKRLWAGLKAMFLS